MTYKMKVDQGKCIGCGTCEALCPEFELKDGKARPKKFKTEKLTCEKEAQNSCPVEAISIEEI